MLTRCPVFAGSLLTRPGSLSSMLFLISESVSFLELPQHIATHFVVCGICGNLFSHSSACWKSEILVSGGPGSLQSRWDRILPCFFQLLEAAHVIWRRATSPQSLCLSHMASSLLVISTLVTGSQLHLGGLLSRTLSSLHLERKTLFTNKVTCTGSRAQNVDTTFAGPPFSHHRAMLAF